MDAISTRPLEQTEPANIAWTRIDTESLEPVTFPDGQSTLLPFISGTEPQSTWSPPKVDVQVIEEKARNAWDSFTDMFR
jgi:hypothetical protein